ncbi:kinase [Hirsutella rhossiliensis]|uniref:Kinase n=1 Tax=Hirsutella rhossiliensis TaxID=111463 RepID=A0A9P8SD30_9HYPO|nr:kinase [Hirsutella rhossiliensis]KAH0957514.1 kinase [Hirsutella rhossiliensis]
METIPIKTCPPWDTYEIIYALHLGDNGPVVVAERIGISFDVVDIGCFAALGDDQIGMLKTIQHPNFVTVHEIYRMEDNCYVAYEHMPRSLEEVAGNPYLNSDRLAAIVGQIVTALGYLEQKGLQHGHLTTSRILLHPSGKVKLGNQEDCTVKVSTKDIRDVGFIMMELMEGDAKDGTTIGLDNPDRWHENAVGFLSATTSASSVRELLEHPFLRSWQKERLKGLTSFVMAWTRPDYEYLGWRNKQ